jgi:DNA-binding response OmpR family regulator
MLKILIVEDEEKVRRMYNTMLTNEGFEVLEAPDALQASNILNTKPVDIMLLDIKMPQVYGSMFYDMIQRSHKKVKVIVASVYPVDEQKNMIVGAADYYDKAQGLDLLLEKIRKIERDIKQQKGILVIDDEAKIRQIYRYYLEGNGYRIIEAHNGNAGLDILRKSDDIALVILDLAMPRKSGFEIFQQIRKEFPKIKILVGSVFNESDQQSFIPNADEYYDKTDDASELVKKIEKLMHSAS